MQLCDFGVSACLTNTINKCYSAVGTAHYAAPEQITGQGADQKADIWAVGIVVIQMLTQKVPNESDPIPAIIQ